MTEKERLERAYKRIRQNQGEPEEESQQAGFEPPTTQIEEILATAKEMSKRYGLLLPFPFSPFESLPKLQERSRFNAVEDMPRVPELPKKEEPKPDPTIVCARCGTPHNASTAYCSKCGGYLQSRWEPDRGYTMRR